MKSSAAEIAIGWLAETPRDRRRNRARIVRIASDLKAAYGTPDLGNLPDPLHEAIYILLSYQTNIPRARQAWHALRLAFPEMDFLDAADEPSIALEISAAGLHHQKAKLIKQLLVAVRHRFGSFSLDGLRTLSTEDAEIELRKLPGLDWKGARCVLLYSLGRDVFPVDSNTFRFMQRYGVLNRSARFRRKALHDGLQALVPTGHRNAFHVNLVAHGQTTCLPQHPRCGQCAVKRSCMSGRAG